MKPKILFFSPHAYIDVHALPEAIVANSLNFKNYDVIYVTCDGVLNDYCVCMSSVNLPYNSSHSEKNKICVECKLKRNYLIKKFGFHSVNIEDFLFDHDRTKISEFCSDLSLDNYLFKEIDGVPIGKFTLYEIILNFKLMSEKIPESLFDFYFNQFVNSAKIYLSLSNMFKIYDIYAFVTYNVLYSVNRTASSVAEKNKINFYTMHASNHLDRITSLKQITIFKGLDLTLPNLLPVNLNQKLQDENRNVPCSPDDLKINFKHTSSFYKSKSLWVYSKQVNKTPTFRIKEKLNIKNKQRVILAVMRSADEMRAAELSGVDFSQMRKGLFSDQVDWLKWLNCFASENPEVFIIFRVHPREFPNKREKVVSENGLRILDILENFPLSSNFYINLPDDQLSLYDILKVTDLLLNNTSSVGLEAALFGIPVLGYGECFPPFDPVLQKEAETMEDYSTLIMSLSSETWDFKKIIIAYRWLRLSNYLLPIDLSDSYRTGTVWQFVLRKIPIKIPPKIKAKISLFGRIKKMKPKNIDKLTFAIQNGILHQPIHLEKVEKENKNEINLIKKDLIKRAKSISGKHDNLFFEKITTMLKNHG
jgi:hypothetical protein